MVGGIWKKCLQLPEDTYRVKNLTCHKKDVNNNHEDCMNVPNTFLGIPIQTMAD